MNKKPEFNFEKPFLLALLVIILVVGSFCFFSCRKDIFVTTQNQNSATVGTTQNRQPLPGSPAPMSLYLAGGALNSSGTSVSSEGWSTDTVSSWNQVTSAVPSATQGRSAFGMVYLNNLFYFFGGSANGSIFNDVWSSPDGVSWTQLSAHAQWSPRMRMAVYVFNNKIYIAGGETLTGYLNDVWSSPDGVTWTQVTPGAPWAPRSGATALVFQNKMWLIGGGTTPSSGVGITNPDRLKDVWSSPDGMTWTHSDTNTTLAGIQDPQWTPRTVAGGSVFQNKMVVLGGSMQTVPGATGVLTNEVWSSPDGVTWTQSTGAIGWSARRSPSVVTYNNTLYVLGGKSSASSPLNDIWSSSDGVSWIQVTPSAPWSGRHEFFALVVPRISIPKPDLVVTNINFLNQPIYQHLTPWSLPFLVTVKNNGNASALLTPSFRTELTSIPTAGVTGALAVVSPTSQITLSPGQSYTFSGSTQSTSIIGVYATTYQVTARTDTTSVISESNETNNTLTIPLVVHALP
jgi:N-acetylneuraminic acid mutarotase